MIFNTVIIEVTRRCNMSCPHCLRGDAQNIDIDLYILESFLSSLSGSYARELLFTGGEPSLNPKAIRKAIELTRKYNIIVGDFTMISNGKGYTNEVINVINSVPNFWVDISLDSYHSKLSDRDYEQLSKVRNLLSKENNATDGNILWKLGKADENNIGDYQDLRDYMRFSVYHDNLILLTNLVCTCNGDVLKDCNYGFHDDSICQLRLCDYDDDIISEIESEVGDSGMYRLETMSKIGSIMYKFFEQLKKRGINI